MTESDRREHRYRLLAILVGLVVVTAADVALTTHGSPASLASAQRFDGAVLVLLAALADALRVLAKNARKGRGEGDTHRSRLQSSRADDDNEGDGDNEGRFSAVPPDPGDRERARTHQRGRARDAPADDDGPAQDARHGERDNG